MGICVYEQANAVFIDPWGLPNLSTTLSMVEEIRHKREEVPICLFATAARLEKMPLLPPEWTSRLSHYYKLPKGLPDVALDSQVSILAALLLGYLAHNTASKSIALLQELVEVDGISDRRRSLRSEEPVAEIRAALITAQRALSAADQKYPFGSDIVLPGMGRDELERLVKSTLAQSVRLLRRSSFVSSGVVIFGLLIVIGAFAVSVATGDWQALVFGGMGLGSIVAALITTPLRSIDTTARRLIQCHMAYMSFLKQ